MNKKFLVIVLLTILSFTSCAQNSINFRTPEAVMEYFVKNIKNGNFENVYRTSPFYYDSIIQKTNPKELFNYYNAIMFQVDPNLPLQYSSVIKYSSLGSYSSGLKRFIFNLLLSDEYPEYIQNYIINPVDDSIIDKYLSSLNINKLNTLEIVRMDIVVPDIQFSERGKNSTIMSYIKPYGCDEKVEYTVLYKFNNKYYTGGVIIVRYDSNWYIQSLNSILLNISTGGLKQISGVVEYLHEYEIE